MNINDYCRTFDFYDKRAEWQHKKRMLRLEKMKKTIREMEERLDKNAERVAELEKIYAPKKANLRRVK